MPKKVARDIAQQVKQLGEEVIKEGARQPLEMAKEAGKQIFGLPRGWGEEGREAQLSTRLIQEKKEETERNLAFARKRIEELTPEPRQPEPEEVPEGIERQRRLAEEKKKRKPLEEVKGKEPRGLPLRVKKRRGTGEIRTGL